MLVRDLQMIDRRGSGVIMSALDVFAVQVVELYLRGVYKKLATTATAKIVVELWPQEQVAVPSASAGHVAFIRWPFDFASIEGTGRQDRKRILLDALHAAVAWMARQQGWATDVLQQAYALSLQAELKFSGWLLERNVVGGKHGLQANCHFEYEDERIAVFIVLFDGEGREVGRKHAFTTATRYDAARRLIGKLVWTGPSRLRTVPSGKSWGETEHEIDVSDLVS